jgi:hypothetical protein
MFALGVRPTASAATAGIPFQKLPSRRSQGLACRQGASSQGFGRAKFWGLLFHIFWQERTPTKSYPMKKDTHPVFGNAADAIIVVPHSLGRYYYRQLTPMSTLLF